MPRTRKPATDANANANANANAGADAIAALPDPDYADTFTVDRPAGSPLLTPETCARLLLEGPPAPVRWFLRVGWRAALGLRLGSPGSSGHILGWRIAERAPDWIRLEQDSRLVRAALVTRVEEGRLAQATFVRFENRVGALVWAPVSLIHRRVVPYLLRRALRAAPAASTPAR